MLRDLDYVRAKLDWMRQQEIWPNGLRYLWTDAFGLVLLVSLYRDAGEARYLDEAEQLVRDVARVLGRPRGLRIGEAPDRDGQYFHYLAMWMFALGRLGEVKPEYWERAIALAKDVHAAFVVPGVGVYWKMMEDLSAPYPGYGFGALDPFNGYAVYRQLDETALAREIADMAALIRRDSAGLRINQDLGLGMMLWLAHFTPEEDWAQLHRQRSLAGLNELWVEPPGYFCRSTFERETMFAFTNYGVSLGLQAVAAWPERVRLLNRFFGRYQSGDSYDTDAITHVMACTSHYPGLFLVQQK
jgi:hypothetical protein